MNLSLAKYIILFIVAVTLFTCGCKGNHFQNEPNSEQPHIQRVYGEIPDNLIFYGQNSIFPYMILDKSKLNNDGEIIEIGSSPLKKHSFLYSLQNSTISIEMEGTPTLLSYNKANAMAFKKDDFAEESLDTIFAYYSYGFEGNNISPIFGQRKISSSNIGVKKSKKNVFFSEFFSCDFFVSKDNSKIECNNLKACVASIYWGKYAKLIIETDLDKQDVWDAYIERLENEKSRKWTRIISNSDVYTEVFGNIDCNTASFFSLLKNTHQISRPIFFSVEN